MQWNPRRKEFFIWHVLPAIAITEEAITGAAARQSSLRTGPSAASEAAGMPIAAAGTAADPVRTAAAISVREAALPVQTAAETPVPPAVPLQSAPARRPFTLSPIAAAVRLDAAGSAAAHPGGIAAAADMRAAVLADGFAIRIPASRSTAVPAARSSRCADA